MSFQPYRPAFTYKEKPEVNVMAWCAQQGFLIRGGKNRRDLDQKQKKARDQCQSRPTLTTMNGCTLFIPERFKKEFLLRVGNHIALNQTPLYLNQIAYDNQYVYFLDIDTEGVVLTDQNFAHILKIQLRELALYFKQFKEHPIEVYLSTSGPRIKHKSGKEVKCRNCHIVVRWRPKTNQEWLQVFYSTKQKIDHYIRMLDVDPSHVEVDAAVLKKDSANLRMLYNYKKEKCHVCNNSDDDRELCDTCGTTGFVINTANYTPLFCSIDGSIADKATFDRLHGSHFQTQILNHQIWSLKMSETRNDFHIPENVPIYEAKEEEKKDGKKKQKTSRVSKNLVKASNPTMVAIRRWIDDMTFYGKPVWRNSDFEIDRNMRTKKSVNVKLHGQHYCVYKKRAHKSHTVFFVLYSDGRVIARCFDPDCKSKKHVHWQFDNQVALNDLFPDACVQLAEIPDIPNIFERPPEFTGKIDTSLKMTAADDEVPTQGRRTVKRKKRKGVLAEQREIAQRSALLSQAHAMMMRFNKN